MRPKKIEPNKDKIIKFRIDSRTYSLFKSFCDDNNTNMSDFLRIAIISFITQEGNIYENDQTNLND